MVLHTKELNFDISERVELRYGNNLEVISLENFNNEKDYKDYVYGKIDKMRIEGRVSCYNMKKEKEWEINNIVRIYKGDDIRETQEGND